jgi:hypothetical protein
MRDTFERVGVSGSDEAIPVLQYLTTYSKAPTVPRTPIVRPRGAAAAAQSDLFL